MRKLPRPFNYSWGSGEIVEEASAPNAFYEPAVQLLVPRGGAHDGEEHVRFCFYSPKGAFQRHPMVIGPEDLEALAEALRETPRLLELLKQLTSGSR